MKDKDKLTYDDLLFKIRLLEKENGKLIKRVRILSWQKSIHKCKKVKTVYIQNNPSKFERLLKEKQI